MLTQEVLEKHPKGTAIFELNQNFIKKEQETLIMLIFLTKLPALFNRCFRVLEAPLSYLGGDLKMIASAQF